MFSALGSTRGRSRSYDTVSAAPVAESRSVLPEISEEGEEGVESEGDEIGFGKELISVGVGGYKESLPYAFRTLRSEE